MARVLVVDDDDQVRFMIRIILERAGHDVAEAADGAGALSAIRRSRPDLLVTDFLMPVMTGEQLIEQVRAEPATTRMPILGVSAHAVDGTRADIVLDKPFHPDLLVDAVNGLLARDGEASEGPSA